MGYALWVQKLIYEGKIALTELWETHPHLAARLPLTNFFAVLEPLVGALNLSLLSDVCAMLHSSMVAV